MSANATPHFLLAFTNDPANPLPSVLREADTIQRALRELRDLKAIEFDVMSNTSLEQFDDLIKRYGDTIHIVHYGGHAGDDFLQLEAATGEAQAAHAEGLAGMLKNCGELRLVFLNGCATLGQVRGLHAAGVRAVIATSVPINDMKATEFAEQFYGWLAKKKTIEEAFASAQAFLIAKYGKEQALGEHRGRRSDDPVEVADDSRTWGLYVSEGGDGVLKWRVPEPDAHKVIDRDFLLDPDYKPNDTLKFNNLPEALAQYNDQAATARDAVAAGKYNDPSIHKALTICFPSPVGEQVRKILAEPDGGIALDTDRLRQLVITYETISKLACFCVLSQLWDEIVRARERGAELTRRAEDDSALNTFMAITSYNEPTFDYLEVTFAAINILAQNNIEPFMPEFKDLPAIFQREDEQLSRRFMQQMRQELAHEDAIAANQIKSFCVQTEMYLEVLLNVFAFLAKYRMTAVQEIELVNIRHQPVVYAHTLIYLGGDSPDSQAQNEVVPYTKPTCNKSIILQSHRGDGSDYLNLTPFIIDDGAIEKQPSSKLFIYWHTDPETGTHRYRFVDNPSVGLNVPPDPPPKDTPLARRQLEQKYYRDRKQLRAPFETMMGDFRATVFGS